MHKKLFFNLGLNKIEKKLHGNVLVGLTPMKLFTVVINNAVSNIRLGLSLPITSTLV
jgi:hypothetical protein